MLPNVPKEAATHWGRRFMRKIPSSPAKEFNHFAVEIARPFADERRQTGSLANYLAAIGGNGNLKSSSSPTAIVPAYKGKDASQKLSDVRNT